ncbi:tyrosine-type recombinase/integrase [Paenibacillaceae bacterium WGS1546]|uniref:tyrosine-type recombinase/integrase n=1 Tax=Cohnella sp. WGS1546 TaxID=3366810 RepID=UPI00372D54F3
MVENNRITRQIEEYVAYKRSLGYRIKIEAQELRRFAKYTREIGYDGSITEELAMRWAALDDHFTRKYMARRLETLHTFAVYISAFDEQAQIPRNGVFCKAHTRTSPYIYTDEEVLSLMRGADSLFSPDGIRSCTVASAIGLMHATGIRVSELTSLRITNVQMEEGYLFIRNSKFKKDRLVPLHPTVIAKLLAYRVFIENKIGVRDRDDPFFVTSYGRRFNTRAFEYAFQSIRPLVFGDITKPPRLFDLRHTFACNTVKRWHEAGEDVNRKLYLLSTYMGHVKPADTYWYLSATPELLEIAARKFEIRFGGDSA